MDGGLMDRFSNTFQMQGEKPVAVADAWDYARSIGAKYVESSSRTKVNSIDWVEDVEERILFEFIMEIFTRIW